MVAQNSGEQVYATLLLNDSYLPGALVLAHSLRDAGTSKKLAVLVTLDSVSAEAVAKLKTVYDHVISVPRIRNEKPANLYLMNRTDLHSAFTKIHLWKLTQFSRVVYIDADVVAYRSPDELFNIPHAFGAAPDIGWPDIFNTGVMVLSPNLGDFHALSALAERGVSFDGADQGLLNQYFGSNFHRLPFTYNVTPSAHYQYLPAYQHFQSSINMVHFIGKNKPWVAGRQASYGNGAYDEMIGRWWAVYDRHYYGQETSTIAQSGDATNSAKSWDASR
ncbi:Glycogenin-1 [Cladobotryum mycophilum]|uniref:Glycogenin-1 n=1 Tax=Cladobotryum mycophilum TaxID=491253 RepID=A0ABR0SV18_9HYPO